LAESERLLRIRLEASIAPRSLTLDQQKQIAAALQKFKGHGVLVSSYAMDGESALLGSQLIAALRAAKIVVANGLSGGSVSGRFETDVHVRSPQSENGFAAALADTLTHIGGLKVVLNDPQPRFGAAMVGGVESFPAGTIFVTVMVGVKSVPILPLK
jgi:hypothetical protein